MKLDNTCEAIRTQPSNIVLFMNMINFFFLSILAAVFLNIHGDYTFEAKLLVAWMEIIFMIVKVWMLLFLFDMVVGITKDVREWRKNKGR